MLEKLSSFSQQILKFVSVPSRVELRFFEIAYTICLVFMLIGAYAKYTYLSVGILSVMCCLFLIETVFLFQKFKDKKITKFLTIIWKPLKYVIGLVIAIWSVGEANTYVYLNLLGEIPSNYTIAVNAMTSVFTLILILFIFSIIFFIAGNLLVFLLQKQSSNFIAYFARLLAFISLFFFLLFFGGSAESIIKQDIGKRIIAHTIFYPNFKCINIQQKYPNEPISIINNSDFALVYNHNDRNISKVKCKE